MLVIMLITECYLVIKLEKTLVIEEACKRV